MFLATTALSEFWDTEEEILFLGSWCLRQDRRDSWSRLRYRVLPSPWNDRERFYRAAAALESCSERMLSLLADRLNTLHDIQAPLRYWRILIGPWLVHHLHAMYDRFVHLQAAFAQEGLLKTLCLDRDSFRVPQDTAEHIDWILDDPYNLQLYSELLTRMGYSFPCRPYSATETPPGNEALWGRVGRWGVGRLEGILIQLLKRRWEIALYETALPRSIVWKMAWRTRFRALPLKLKDRWCAGFSAPVFDSRRNSLSCLPFQDEFERIFVQMLPQSFPSLYLEGYLAAREETLRRLPKTPAVILSAVGWHFHEPFQWAAAEAALKGRRLVALQHGGGYGVYRCLSTEQHESRISDTYCVWGWANRNGGHSKNVPAPQLSVLARRFRSISSHRRKSILFVATTNPLYFYRFCSNPQGSQMEDYFQWQFRFFASLSSQLRDRILFRLHRHPYAHGLRERVSERFPDLRFDNGSTFHRSLSRSSLAVIDHLSTSVLEVLAANRPTVLFWDPQRWEVRPEAEPFFDSLRRAGILWDSPERAATQMEKISGSLEEWWLQLPVQQARREFVDRYARSRGDWARVWQRMLADEVSLAGKP